MFEFVPILLLSVLAAIMLALLERLRGRRLNPRLLAAPALGIFFLLLTQLPLPDPATMTCPQAAAAPRLQPLHTIARVRVLFDYNLAYWLGNRNFFAALANLGICGAIGIAIGIRPGWPHPAAGPSALAAGGQPQAWRRIVALALLGPLAVELTQLTGTWGIFPCAYRQFDVDDLILNGAGLAGGYALVALAGMWRRRVPKSGQRPKPAGVPRP